MFLEMNDNEQDKLFYPKAMKLHSLGLTQKPQLNSLITQLRRHGFDINLNKDGFKLVDIIYKEKPKQKTQCFKPSINPLLIQVFR